MSIKIIKAGRPATALAKEPAFVTSGVKYGEHHIIDADHMLMIMRNCTAHHKAEGWAQVLLSASMYFEEYVKKHPPTN